MILKRLVSTHIVGFIFRIIRSRIRTIICDICCYVCGGIAICEIVKLISCRIICHIARCICCGIIDCDISRWICCSSIWCDIFRGVCCSSIRCDITVARRILSCQIRSIISRIIDSWRVRIYQLLYSDISNHYSQTISIAYTLKGNLITTYSPFNIISWSIECTVIIVKWIYEYPIPKNCYSSTL